MKKIIIIALLAALLAIPAPARAAQPERILMAQTINVPFRQYTPGNYEVELRTLPGNSEGAEFLFTRSNLNTLPAAPVAQIDVYMSRNNGATWQHVQGMQLSGGLILDKQGNPLTASRFLFTWPGENQGGSRVKLKGSDVKVVAQVLSTFSTQITINSLSSTGGNR